MVLLHLEDSNFWARYGSSAGSSTTAPELVFSNFGLWSFWEAYQSDPTNLLCRCGTLRKAKSRLIAKSNFQSGDARAASRTGRATARPHYAAVTSDNCSS